MKPRSRSPIGAFTLLELLVVISILAILAGLIFSGVQSVRGKADAAQSAHHIRTLAQANGAYLAENGRYVPADDRQNNRRWHGARRASKEAFDPTLGFLAAYLGKSGRIVTCPVFQKMTRGSKSFEEGTGGYGYNATYIGGTPAWQYNADGIREAASGVLVESPANTVMFTSTAFARADGVQEYPYCEPPYWDFGSGPAGFRPSPSVHFRFAGKALVAWCDGHVTFEPPIEREAGANPYGGESDQQKLGWFGPDENNGFWNPQK